MAKSVVFFDTEVSIQDKKVHDIGAVRTDNAVFHGASVKDFCAFLQGADFICGHNIVHHDLNYLQGAEGNTIKTPAIDTLYLSPLLFPRRPYHSLVKDDKLQVDQLNNPVNDSQKAKKLFYDEVNAFYKLPPKSKQIYCHLLSGQPEFAGFFAYVNFKPYRAKLSDLIRAEYEGKICANADLDPLIRHYPVELAYAVALIGTGDALSVTPPWLLYNYPKIENVVKYLCGTPCTEGCPYCQERLDVHRALKTFFGYDSFRTYNGEPLQELAAKAAVAGDSLLAVFPTGGGKSITFQLPALMAGRAVHGLTVVISPLQSLMKDQVDNLNSLGFTEAVTINGLLDPIERKDAIERVSNGSAALLYISPEQLRSRTIEKLLLSRNIARFVIDEAHCFSAWGQDFRVDYLYIGDFIRELQKNKAGRKPIPVSCFTATAKQKVISDICDYFKRKLGLELKIFASTATRENLHYTVLFKETEDEKYITLRNLIAQKNCPTIVYVSRTKRTFKLAQKLTEDGFPALPFNGKMEANDKIANQEAFIRNEVKIIVATSAFGMGVDKKDVKLVVHYDISDSLENYVQEAGRAGRDPSLQADCYVLFNDGDLDKHFILLNQTKLSISEIQQVWKAVKDLTKQRPTVCCSALEIARQAGWDDSVHDIETRVRTAIAALENAGYVRRGRNMPHVYATSILVGNMQEASARIERSALFSGPQRLNAKRIMKSLISSRSIAKAGNDDAESRVDYLADTLGLTKEEVLSAVNLMRQEGLLDDDQDLSAFIHTTDTENRSRLTLDRFSRLEAFLLSKLPEEGREFSLKELNEAALESGIAFASVKNIRTVLYYLTIKNYIRKAENNLTKTVYVTPLVPPAKLQALSERKIEVCRFILHELYEEANNTTQRSGDNTPVVFSLVGLYNRYMATPRLETSNVVVTIPLVEDALLYLSKIGAMKIEGGFLVLYSGMEINRLIRDNKVRYKVDDYRLLDEFYKQKIRQIHIVGEYANLMVRDYDAALQFVQDYFQMDFRKFIAKYFKGERAKEIERNITPDKYNQLFQDLSDKQSEIIMDSKSRYIVVAAGPGSGKTRVLVHKLASLLLLEDVKHEQLLMLTFSRAAATEFKKRLRELVDNAANFVEIKTFHSYCFDLLGKIGSLEGSEDVVRNAAEMIEKGEVEPNRIAKAVLVIDEAQDMDENEFRLVRALMHQNEDMRVIAVGDDDQNIFSFRGSDSKYLQALVQEYGAASYEMTENYRSGGSIVALANWFAAKISVRMKHKEITAVRDESGIVRITQYDSAQLAIPVAEDVIENRGTGSACVLTSTNAEAEQVAGLLQEHGVRAKLIQSVDGFKLTNLVEIRYLLKTIDRGLQTPVISDEKWDQARQKLIDQYADSACLENCLNLMREFEMVHETKYRRDLEEYISESNYEDFYTQEQETVFVSTIHKAKGREFDSVFMLLNGAIATSDEEKRKLYVGMTRAKQNLRIHSNTSLFHHCEVSGIDKKVDHQEFPMPANLTLQLTHRDVVLDYFKGKQDLGFKLHSGTTLSVSIPYLCAEVEGKVVRIAKLSKAFVEQLSGWENRGYSPCAAGIRFVVAWKGKDDLKEIPILLPYIQLRAHEENS